MTELVGRLWHQFLGWLSKSVDWSKAIGISAISVTDQIHATMVAAGAMIVLDFFTGVWRAKKAKETLTSRGYGRTLNKFIGYQVAIVTAWVMEKYMIGALGIPVVNVIATAIAVVEGKSIMENLTVITGTDFWAVLQSKIQPPKDSDK